jgi:dolichol-phosphate mannosyltransferase
VFTLLLIAQSIALVVLIGRLLPGRRRRPPVLPTEDEGPPRVSVILPTLNEALRLKPCLEGLMKQRSTVREILVVDGHSTDGTVGLVNGATAHDSRVRTVQEPPLPRGWVGKVWALQHGLEQTSGEWVMNVDADIRPGAGMVAAAVSVAEELKLGVVSFSPRFADMSAAEQWLQPALLVSLLYRAGAVGANGIAPPRRTMANGQCFLARRDVLLSHGGYAAARASFSDDVTLARHLAQRGVRVGFLDGSCLFRVRSYESLGEMWREWGRSIDLKDATTRWRQAGDVLLLALVQGAPAIVVLLWVLGVLKLNGLTSTALVIVNVAVLLIRAAMSAAIAGSYEKRRWTFWLSPLADPIAVLRVAMSSLARPRQWRGRFYAT